MVKGLVSPRPLAPNLVEDSAPSFRPAAVVTTYAAAGVCAAGASAPAGFGGCAAMTARKAGTPPFLFTTPMSVNAISDSSPYLVRLVIPDLDRVVRAGAVLQVQLT